MAVDVGGGSWWQWVWLAARVEFCSGFRWWVWQWVWVWVWAVVVGWVGFCNGFKFVSQWVSVDFSGQWQWQWQWVGFLMVVVAWVF